MDGPDGPVMACGSGRIAAGESLSRPRRCEPVRLLRLLPLLPLLSCVSCGVKGPPRPPPPRQPEAVRSLEVRQEGERLIVSFTAPKTMESGGPLIPPVRFEILESVVERTSSLLPAPGLPASGAVQPLVPVGLSPAARASPAQAQVKVTASQAAAMMRLARPVTSVLMEVPGQRVEVALHRGDFPGTRLEGSRLTFGVAVIDGRGHRSAPAEVQVIEPVPPPPAPSSLAATVTAEGVKVTWHPPDVASYPGSIGPLRLALYRWSGDQQPSPRPYSLLPPGASEFLDKQPPAGSRWVYALRLSAGPGPPRRESDTAGPAEVEVRDVFPPSVPQGLVAVSEPSVIRLFWFPSPEPDLAGYRVYRAEAEEGRFEPVTPDLLTETSYEDASVVEGKTYLYQVTAVDKAVPPNESGPSQSVSQSAGAAPRAGEEPAPKRGSP